MKSCKTCALSSVRFETGKLICRAHPPEVHVIATPAPQGINVHTITAWAEVTDADWCNHHSQETPAWTG